MTNAPTGRDASSVADWIELQAIAYPPGVTQSALVERGAQYALRPDDIALGLTHIRLRQQALGGAYPFMSSGGAIAAQDSLPSHPWTALLLMSGISPLRTQSLEKLVVQFEEITAKAMEAFWGPQTVALRFGWPSAVGRPREFPDAIRWLADRMFVPVGNSYRPPATKDGGVDVVVWRPFGDRRSGFPVALVQCTLEQDFRHKVNDVDVRVWAGWLALDVSPTVVLAVPEVIPHGLEWDSLATRAVLVDRIRLALLLTESGVTVDPESTLGSWVLAGLKAIRGVQS